VTRWLPCSPPPRPPAAHHAPRPRRLGLTPARTAATEETWTAAHDAVIGEVNDELRAIWSGLSTGQSRALTSVAEKTTALYAADRAPGGSRGGALRPAVQALEDRGEIRQHPTAPTGRRLIDLLLAAWVRGGREHACMTTSLPAGLGLGVQRNSDD
jgi:hypothetical protein